MENGEDPRIALIREIAEESGIQPQQLNVEDKLTTYQRFNPHTKKINIRHVYHCSIIEPLNKKWSHVVQGEGTDKNDRYDFEFVPLFKPLKVDAGLGQGLDLLKRKILSQSNLKNVPV